MIQFLFYMNHVRYLHEYSERKVVSLVFTGRESGDVAFSLAKHLKVDGVHGSVQPQTQKKTSGSITGIALDHHNNQTTTLFKFVDLTVAHIRPSKKGSGNPHQTSKRT
jgi:hypothetical protein